MSDRADTNQKVTLSAQGLSIPWAATVHETLAELDVHPSQGLSTSEASARLGIHGPNQIREVARVSGWSILLNQFKSVIIALLGAATIVSLALGEVVEAIAIGVVIMINTLIGFVTEVRAVRSMESLRELGRVMTNVRRDGEVRTVPADEVVPGDLIVVEAGDVISADARLIEASRVEVDESPLTGESLPVAKGIAPAPEDAVLAERPSLLYKGTAVTSGSGEAVVIATGIATELGRISELVYQSEEQETPLQTELADLGRRLLWLTLAVAVAVALLSAFSGREVTATVETAVALAVAAIPEGLPIVATVALARGMRRMAKRGVLISRLAAVETLGSVGVILTDKTGTLTENEMVLARLALSGATTEVGGGYETTGQFLVDGERLDPEEMASLRRALEIGALCNNASIGGGEVVGDPTEVALLMGAAKAGIDRHELLQRMPEVIEEAFNPGLMMMATVHELPEGGFLVAVKGAPDAVMNACSTVGDTEDPLDDQLRNEWGERNHRMAADGLRVLALAAKSVDSTDANLYSDLNLVALAAMVDPPRVEVRDAIEECRHAGIEVVMVTGDQAATAGFIAGELGMGEGMSVITGRQLAEAGPEDDGIRRSGVYARTTPEQKLDLIAARQAAGESVAMIGDGVNDAPALKKADIGVAMGIRGTEVAKEASDVVIGDDRFGSIVAAIKEGRVIFDNIRKFVLYLLSSNLSEIIVVAVGSVLTLPIPILPLQILYLNLITDVFPALALGAGKGDPGVMDRPPRPRSEGVLTRSHWISISGFGILLGLPVLGVLGYASMGMGVPDDTAVTMSFMTLAFAQLWHVFNMSGVRESPWRNDITTNPWVWAALAISTLLLLIAMYVPGLASVMNVVSLDGEEWLVVTVASLVPLILATAARPLRRRFS